MNLNLVLAVFWLIFGVLTLTWHYKDPNAPFANFGGTGISAGWLALLFVLWNLVRWWSTRTYMADRQAQRSVMEARRRRDEAESPPRPQQPPDPNFNFSDPGRDQPQ